MANIVLQGIVKQKNFLVDQRDLCQNLFSCNGKNVLSANGYATAVGLVILADEIQNGGFAGTGVTDDSGQSAVRDGEGHVLQNGFAGDIGERNVCKDNVMR